MATKAQAAKSNAVGFPWGRLWFLLGALFVYRIGAHIPVPGIDPVQFGIVMILNLILGTIHPPIGSVLVVVTRIANVSFEAMSKACGGCLEIVTPSQTMTGPRVPTPTEIVIKGADRQSVGQVAAKVREVRPPEPYKGKGIRYADERVVIKETKKK